MKYLLDTHILLWAVEDSPKLSQKARQIIDNPENELLFSVVSIWEIAIKVGRGKDDFSFDPNILCRVLLDADYLEIPVLGHHVPFVQHLPDIHKDFFDRLLIATAKAEGFILVTADSHVAKYDNQIVLV